MDLIAVPSIGKSIYAVGLYRTFLASLTHGPYTILIMDNGSGGRVESQMIEAGLDRYATLMNTEGQNISQQWASAFRLARKLSIPRVHIFNDDVVLNSASIPAMTALMHANPHVGICGYDYHIERSLERVAFERLHYVSGTYREGGIGGFAFCARTDGPTPDEQFEWWGGDDDLVWQYEASGNWRCAVAIGVPVRHPEPETSAITKPELAAAKSRDRERLLAKWGRSW
jgi:hypothetical protein